MVIHRERAFGRVPFTVQPFTGTTTYKKVNGKKGSLGEVEQYTSKLPNAFGITAPTVIVQADFDPGERNRCILDARRALCMSTLHPVDISARPLPNHQ
jgi:hypothetical protein